MMAAGHTARTGKDTMLAQDDDDAPRLHYLALLGWERLDSARASYLRGVVALREAAWRLRRSRGGSRQRAEDDAAGCEDARRARATD